MNQPKHIALLCHPATPCTAVEAIEVTAENAAAGGLELNYRIRGHADRIALPPPLTSGPADNLWQHTCCEAFVSAANQKNYQEFNFSPSGQWAAYLFTDYRARNNEFLLATAPLITVERLPDGFMLKARLASGQLPADQLLQLGLTAVIETTDGSKSYWALQHGAPQPDFHLRSSFALTQTRNTP